MIRPPAHAELELLLGIERDAGQAFADHGMPEIAAADPGTVAELEAYRAAGAAWVAVDAHNSPIGYIITSAIDDALHVDQVSVAPAHRGGRIGAALIDHVAALARSSGRSAVTLTTFRDIPWNAPYYARLGFAELAADAWGPELRALVTHEPSAVPGDAPRVVMARPV